VRTSGDRGARSNAANAGAKLGTNLGANVGTSAGARSILGARGAAVAVVAAIALVVGTGGAGLGCRTPGSSPGDGEAARPLVHEAYVWQRSWTGSVARSVAGASSSLAGLRVLMAEVEAGDAVVWPDVDAAALAQAHRPVTAVVRIDGSRLADGAPIGAVLARLDIWRRAGVDVVGLELDHDAATAALPAYAAWLRTARANARASGSRSSPPLRWSITALPAWASSPALAELAATVDELVVQVHAVRAPSIFEPVAARRWLEAFASAVPAARLRVALPTYAVTLDGARIAAEPATVATFVRALERRPVASVAGVVWFRLPTDGDRSSWSAPTLDAVIAGRPLAPRIEARLVATGPDLHDVVLVNRGTVDGGWPPLRLTGAVAAMDLVGGYVAAGDGAWTAPRRTLAPGAETVVGWATGKDLRLDVP
jgi:hypothetical protein